ncbi:SNF2-related protein [Fibrella aestuarina BUZ 2]|uniref:SNF2-related protein n=2 Tax=Fibrella TaxID=861914 RepID=I0KEM1_9BACT|nr:SNF2-related protein [Fibrella aestuarina BUZ 2]
MARYRFLCICMKVSPSEPFQVVYSLLEHEYLGFLVEAFVVHLNAKGELTLQTQSLSPQNVREFSAGLDERDFELVRLTDYICQDTLLRRFNTKKLSAVDFFLKVYDPQKGDKVMQDAICDYVERTKAQIFPLLAGKTIFLMTNDGDPVGEAVTFMPEPARVFFHFDRNPNATHYYPIIRYPTGVDATGKPTTERVEFQHRNALILCDEPAWLLVNNKLYHFARLGKGDAGVEVDGKKLRPFLNKNHIVVPKNMEAQYYQRFMVPLIAQYDVFAKGFEIRYAALSPSPVLTLSERVGAQQAVPSAALFGDLNQIDVADADDTGSTEVVFDLSFQYGDFTFRFDSFANAANVSLEQVGDEFVFHKIKRDLKAERQRFSLLRDQGLDLRNGRLAMPKTQAFSWLNDHRQALIDSGFQLRQNADDTRRYFLGYSSLDISIRESRDWFDIHAKVRFGDFEIPFLKLRNLILNNKREFALPNGEIAVIPEAWFVKYAELVGFTELSTLNDELGLSGQFGERVVLPKHHLSLVQELDNESLAETVISRRLEGLREFEGIDEFPMPNHFLGTLRPYQKAGYDWMNFLRQYHFGGCLADDMGLGKTVMTLAMLQGRKEANQENESSSDHCPSLLVMPTSLLYNWELEARRFTPDLRVLVYTGTYRDKNTAQFDGYDLILTSYGIVRIDIDLLKNYRFDYVIMDESQAIKNPNSYITRAVMQLNSAHRLILTGTPLENSTMDLWTQMTFINPGLLGSQSFFRNTYQVPIEKRNDEQKMQKLYSLIKPFMLRRNKKQVATDLPPKVESVLYCDMTAEQEKTYEEAKSYYRNLILERIEADGMAKSQMVVLQGLTKLRQIANHPRLVDLDYKGESGKLQDVWMRLETALGEGHKILIFSQFIKHLAVVKQYLKEKQIRYAYLDGGSTDRQEQVARFQTDDSVQLFLISLKAGGLGHNLTAADYVFLLDPWWNPAIEAQAVDRAHRIGQQKPVFTYKFITKNTVEEKILALQRNKQRLASELVTSEESFVKSLTKEDVLVLLE